MQLIDNIIDDVHKFQLRVIEGYKRSSVYTAYRLRDLTPFTSNLGWAKIIKEKLEEHMRFVDQILGSEWKNNSEEKELFNDSNSFLRKLDTKIVTSILT